MYDVLRAFGHFLISPVNQAIILVIVVIVLAYFRKSAFRYLVITLIVHFLFFSSKFGLFLTLKPLENAYDLPRKAESVDAVVVLSGGTIQCDPTLSLNVWRPSSSRILEAIRLMKESNARFLIISGGTPAYSGPLMPEAESMRRLATESGIPEEQILLESRSQTTAEHSVELRSTMTEKNINSFYLVTSAFHMLRAAKTFEKNGFHPIPFPVGKIYPYEEDYFDTSYFSFQKLAISEWVGLLVYTLRGLI